MNQIKAATDSFDNTVRNLLSPIDDNEYVSAGLTLFLIVYAAYAAPRLPGSILRLFDYTLVKLLMFFMIVYMARRNPTVAIIAAIGLMVTLHALNRFKLDQMMMSLMNREAMQQVAAEEAGELGELAMEEAGARSEMEVPEEELAGLQEEVNGGEGCARRGNYRNNFYPQYVHMKPDAYLSRYTGNEVNGFDPNSGYASI